MKKAALLKKLKTNRAIADLLGISVQAVTKWKIEAHIPKGREQQLRDKRPDLFAEAK